MAMTFHFNIHPFGYSAAPIKFAGMDVHSAGTRHEYTVYFKTEEGIRAIHGSIAKLMPDGSRRSGHRNVLHLLQDILNDMDLDALGEDYINVAAEIKEATGLQASDYAKKG